MKLSHILTIFFGLLFVACNTENEPPAEKEFKIDYVKFTLDNGLEVNGFQSQADFLLAGGITELSQAQENDPLLMLQQASEIKQLTLPSAMGENFKVLTLSKSLNQLLPRCQLADRRYTL